VIPSWLLDLTSSARWRETRRRMVYPASSQHPGEGPLDRQRRDRLQAALRFTRASVRARITLCGKKNSLRCARALAAAKEPPKKPGREGPMHGGFRSGTDQARSCSFVIFGVTGDSAHLAGDPRS
jgi:hypothetical protein